MHEDEADLIEDWARVLHRSAEEAFGGASPEWTDISAGSQDRFRAQAALMLDHAKQTHGHPDLSKVTRVTLVHPVRRLEYERRDWDGVLLAIQDDGTTLKVLPRSEFLPYVGVAL